MNAPPITTLMPETGDIQIAPSAARSPLAPIRTAVKAGEDHAD